MICLTPSSLICSVNSSSGTKIKDKTREDRSWLIFHAEQPGTICIVTNSHYFLPVCLCSRHSLQLKEASSFPGNQPICSALVTSPPGSLPCLPAPASLQVLLFCTFPPLLHRGSYQLCYNCLFTFLCPSLECELCEGQDCAIFLKQCPVNANSPQK